eukprot:13957529-Ditylum_brightwellii.AAC.1
MATGCMLVKQTKKKKTKKKCDVVVPVNPGNYLMSGILEENMQVADVFLPELNNFEDHVGSNSESDNRSQCDAEDLTFIPHNNDIGKDEVFVDMEHIDDDQEE